MSEDLNSDRRLRSRLSRNFISLKPARQATVCSVYLVQAAETVCVDSSQAHNRATRCLFPQWRRACLQDNSIENFVGAPVLLLLILKLSFKRLHPGKSFR